jgi:putative ABC transport system permease protein
LPEINQQLDLLTIPKNVLFDRLGQPQLGKITQLFIQDGEVITIMNNRMIRIAGLFNMGSTVFDQGHVVMSDWNYGIQNGNNILKKISVGILTLEQGVSKKTIIDNIKKNLSKDVKAVSKEELMQIEQNYIAQFPEGKILNFGVAIGFIVGVVVVYQVLYTDVSEHLSEYATLKAIGYSDRFLLKIVLQEAIILGIVGFIPSFFISYGVYNFLESNTKIPLQMSFDIIVKVFILTIFMCCFSGFIAVKKLSDANPADIF